MCRHEVITFGCGHVEDLGFYCDYAQGYGPLFIKAGCPNYTHGGTKNEPHLQCGSQRHFYCARTQDGVVIDKSREAMSSAKAVADDRKPKFEHLATSCANYLGEAAVRNIPREELAKVPHYRQLDQQRRYLEFQYTVANNRYLYLNAIINHAWRNRDELRFGVRPQPMWDGMHFDFATSIFPSHILRPILHQFPGFEFLAPDRIPKIPVADNSDLHRAPPPTFNYNMNTALVHQTQSADHARSMQRAKTTQVAGPVNHTTGSVKHSSSLGQAILRGNSPEGEDKMAKAIRYRNELAAKRSKDVSEAMAGMGYDVQNNGLRPAPKVGNKRSAQPTPTPPRKKKAQSSTVQEPESTPTKNRSSRRTRNTKPKYVESPDSSEKTLGFREASLDKSDEAWVASPTKSDEAWAESPTKSDAAWVNSPTISQESLSPIRPVRNSQVRNKRKAQPLTGSPNSSPMRTQTSLGEKILQYQKGTGTVGPPQMQEFGAPSNKPFSAGVANTVQPDLSLQTNARQVPRLSTTLHSAGQMPHESMYNGVTFGANAEGAAHYNPQQKAALMQRGAQLAEDLGRDLYQQQLAAGIVGISAANSTHIPALHQQQAMPNMGRPPQAMQSQHSPTTSYTLSPGDGVQRQHGTSNTPANLFHQNYQESMTAAGTQMHPESAHRYFSLGSAPASMSPNQFSTGIPPAGMSHQSPTLPGTRADYENMRRSFSATANFTPQPSSDGPNVAATTEPLKRSMAPTSPAVTSRKRPRLSYPGEDDVPRLTPSSSSFEPYIPTGELAELSDNLSPRDAPSEPSEGQYRLSVASESAALGEQPFSNAPNSLGSQSGHVDMGAPRGIPPIDPQLISTSATVPDPQATSFTDLRHHSLGADATPVDPQLYKHNFDLHAPQTIQHSLDDVVGDIAEQTSLPQPQEAAGDWNSWDSSSEPDWTLLQDGVF